MKKLLAILLAVLLLGTSTAFAESAEVFTLSPTRLRVETEAQQMDILLSDLDISVAVADETPTLQFTVGNGQETLLRIDAQAVDNRLVFAMDGVSGTYYVQLPQESDFSSDIAVSPEDLTSLMETALSEVEFSAEGDTMYFSLPYTAVNDLLELLLTSGLVKAGDSDTAALVDAIREFQASDSGINLEGSMQETDRYTTLTVNCIPVQNGQKAESPIATASLKIGEDIRLDVTAGETATFQFNLYDEGEDKIVNILAEADGESYELSGKVSLQESDIAFRPIKDADDALDLLTLSEEQQEALIEEVTHAAQSLVDYMLAA